MLISAIVTVMRFKTVIKTGPGERAGFADQQDLPRWDGFRSRARCRHVLRPYLTFLRRGDFFLKGEGGRGFGARTQARTRSGKNARTNANKGWTQARIEMQAGTYARTQTGKYAKSQWETSTKVQARKQAETQTQNLNEEKNHIFPRSVRLPFKMSTCK